MGSNHRAWKVVSDVPPHEADDVEYSEERRQPGGAAWPAVGVAVTVLRRTINELPRHTEVRALAALAETESFARATGWLE